MNCKPGVTSDTKLEEAAKIHEEAMSVAHHLGPDLENLNIKRNLLLGQQELTCEDSLLLERINRVDKCFQWFQRNHVEVPGFEHAHDHGDHDHSHDHGPKLDLTPEDMLLVQKEFRDSIFLIRDLIQQWSL